MKSNGLTTVEMILEKPIRKWIEMEILGRSTMGTKV